MYYLRNWQRPSQLLALRNQMQRTIAKYETEVLTSELKSKLSLINESLCCRVTLGTATGVCTIQGSSIGVLQRLQEKLALMGSANALYGT